MSQIAKKLDISKQRFSVLVSNIKKDLNIKYTNKCWNNNISKINGFNGNNKGK